MTHRESVDANLQSVLRDDGISNVDAHNSINGTIACLPEVKGRMGTPPWSVRVVHNEVISAVLICQNPGEGNRWHYHPESDEFWVMLEGEMEWDIEDVGKVTARTGDVVFVPRRRKHVMRTVGDRPSIRLAIGAPDVPHIFVQR